MNSVVKVVLSIVVLIIVVVGGYFVMKMPNSNSNNGPIEIGWIGPLTGDAASIGINEKAAAELAADEVNKAGGINGRQIKMIFEDGQCNGSASINAANKLINIDKVSVILGGMCSAETMSFTATAEKSKTVVLSPCSSNPAITSAGDYIFRDYPSDNYQGSFAANYIFNTLGKKKVAILYAQTDWSAGIKTVFTDTFTKLGGTIVADEGFDQTTKDISSQLAKVKAAKPDLIYFLGYTNESIVGIKQAAQLGLNVPMFGGDPWSDATIWTSVKPAGEGYMFLIVSTPLTDAFTTAMKAKTGVDTTICSPEAYDGVKMLAQVMSKVGTDPEKIKNELYKTVYTGGVSAPSISFDSNGDLVGANYSVQIVHDGKTSPVK